MDIRQENGANSILALCGWLLLTIVAGWIHLVTLPRNASMQGLTGMTFLKDLPGVHGLGVVGINSMTNPPRQIMTIKTALIPMIVTSREDHLSQLEINQEWKQRAAGQHCLTGQQGRVARLCARGQINGRSAPGAPGF